MDYLLVSVPTHSLQDAELKSRTMGRGISRNSVFSVPASLRVGTLDELVSLSDDLLKIDQFVYSVALKLSSNLGDLLGHDKSKIEEALLADGRNLPSYTESFEWDSAKYNIKLSIRDIAQNISKHITGIEHDMKSRVGAYSKSKQALQAIERKSNGSLLVRGLADVVKPEHVVNDSEFLITLLVVVPKYNYKEWERDYPSMNDFVVPSSSELVTEDAEYGLWTVTVFRKMVDDFKNACREKKYVVRDYEYKKQEVEQDEEERRKLKQDITKKYSVLLNWVQMSFSEAFTAWIHIKALRLFVESVLRYGLPPEFTALTLKHEKSSVKKLRLALEQLYSHLDKVEATANSKAKEDVIEIAGLTGTTEYYPYVSFDVSLQHFYPQR